MADKKEKQDYLYTEIIEKGYDSTDFVGYIQHEREGGMSGMIQARISTTGVSLRCRMSWIDTSENLTRSAPPSLRDRTSTKTELPIWTIMTRQSSLHLKDDQVCRKSWISHLLMLKVKNRD